MLDAWKEYFTQAAKTIHERERGNDTRGAATSGASSQESKSTPANEPRVSDEHHEVAVAGA
jgi:hypothetical protein